MPPEMRRMRPRLRQQWPRRRASGCARRTRSCARCGGSSRRAFIEWVQSGDVHLAAKRLLARDCTFMRSLLSVRTEVSDYDMLENIFGYYEEAECIRTTRGCADGRKRACCEACGDETHELPQSLASGIQEPYELAHNNSRLSKHHFSLLPRRVALWTTCRQLRQQCTFFPSRRLRCRCRGRVALSTLR